MIGYFDIYHLYLSQCAEKNATRKNHILGDKNIQRSTFRSKAAALATLPGSGSTVHD